MRAGRDPKSVTLIAVTKTVDVDHVEFAIRCGALELGENYVQEARDKILEISRRLALAEDNISAKQPVWHLIGRLQSNKAKYAVHLFDVIQTVDSASLAREIGRQATKFGKVQSVLVEVNLDADSPDRAGVAPASLDELVNVVLETPGLALNGLMGIAPVNINNESSATEAARPHFSRLRSLWETLPIRSRQVLSMGMSADFEAAIEEGATVVRIGAAIFGRRKV